MDFIAVDFETANSNRSSICSMGVAIVEKGKLVGTEHFYVKPTPNYYDGFNTFLHGISDKDTKNEKTFKQQWKVFKQYFDKQTVIAHNASFDFSVLRYTLDEVKLAYPDLDYHCTFRLSQVALPLPSHRLNDVSNHFKIKLKHHNAESDAKASALIALKLCDKFKVSSLEELSSSFGFKTGKIISETRSYKAFSNKGSGQTSIRTKRI
jgi:DNA polymerase-3 subunit epsilon